MSYDATSTTPDLRRAPEGLKDGSWVPMASWGSRFVAGLIDQLLLAIGAIPQVIALVLLVGAMPDGALIYETVDAPPIDTGTVLLALGLSLLGSILTLVIFFWNRVIQQGRTGQSVGKSVMNLYLVGANTGVPIGAGTAFIREIAHVVDGIFYIGYLWPLWDLKRQTFADKLVNTVVAHPAQRPEPHDVPAFLRRT